MSSEAGVSGLDLNLARSERTFFGLNRPEAVYLAFACLAANAIVPSATGSVEQFGWAGAVMAAFNVSVIVWAGIWMGLEFCAEGRAEPPSTLDRWVVGMAIIVCFLPIGGATWLVLTAFAGYIILKSTDDDRMRRSGWIFLAMTVPMFWGRRLFNLFSDHILTIDAYFVSLATQTERIGNTVQMPGGAGVLLIGAPCSSMANMSLAVLCWTLFTQNYRVRWSMRNLYWCVGACFAVMAINVIRIAIIGFFPQYYELLHDGSGVVVFSWLSAIASVIVCYIGVKHGNLQKA